MSFDIFESVIHIFTHFPPRYYFEMLAEELFLDKQYSDAKKMIDNFQKMFPGPNFELKLLSALISRYWYSGAYKLNRIFLTDTMKL